MDSTNLQKICPFCFQVFHSNDNIEIHILTYHFNAKLICQICNCETTIGKPFVDHSIKHSSKKDKCFCAVCDQRFCSVRNLRRHLKSIHMGMKKEYSCECCDKLLSKYTLKIHRRRLAGDFSHKCDMCQKQFLLAKELKIHKDSHTEKTVPCSMCSAMFASNQKLKRHMYRVHPPINSTSNYQCDTCGKEFVTKIKLNAHVARVHSTTMRMHQCHLCPSIKKNAFQLRRHIYINHSGYTYQCKLCDNKFGNKFAFKKHLAGHTASYDFTCILCDKAFKTKQCLDQHLRAQHTSERKFVCEICGTTFKLRGHLTTHLKSHSDLKLHECDICGKSFTLPHHMRNHRKTHNKNLNDKKIY